MSWTFLTHIVALPHLAPGWAKSLAAAGLMAMALLLPAPAIAQVDMIVGLWSTTVGRGGGEPYAAFWFQFGPGGDFRERVTTSNSEMFYSGIYELSDDGALAYRLDDYDPKQKCSGGICLPWQPSMPIGQVMHAHVDLIDVRTFILSQGSERFEFHRQQ